MTTETSSLHIAVKSTGIEGAEQDLRGLEKQGSRTERATDNLNRSFKKMNTQSAKTGRGLGNMRHVATGVGFQLQDIAVQAQTGTNAFIILGQQGSQIASLFGPGGAIAGALLAIGAAIVGAGFSAFDTSKKLKKLEEEALQLSDAFSISANGALVYNERLSRLADTAPGVAEALFQIKRAQLELEQTLARGALRDGLEDFQDLTSLLESRTTQSFEKSKTSAFLLKETLGNLTKEFGGTSAQVIGVSRALEDFKENSNKDTASGLVDALSKLKGGSVGAQKELVTLISLLGQYVETSNILEVSNDPFEKQNKSVLSLVASLELEAVTLNKTNRERDLYVAKLNDATEGQLKAINAAHDAIEADGSRSVIERLEAQLLSEEEKIDASYMRRREIVLANTEEGSIEQSDLLNQVWEKYEADYDAFQDRLLTKDEARARKQEAIEARVSRNIIRQKKSVVDSGVSLLKTLTAGNEKAAKAIVVVEAGLNVARTIQNTAAASVRALAELGPIAGPPAATKIQAYGQLQAGIIAANAVLQLGASGSSGGGAVSISTGGSSSQSELSAPASIEDTRQPIQIVFNGDVVGFTKEELAETLRDHITESDFVLVEANSRNGQELQG